MWGYVCMLFHNHSFAFDTIYNFNVDPLLSQKTDDFTPTPTPVEGFLLETNTTPLLLTDGTFILLA